MFKFLGIATCWSQYLQQYGAKAFEGPEHKKHRHFAYRQFVRWCWDILSKEIKVPLPSGAVSCIRAHFLPPGLGPVHMGRSYLGSRENISTGQIMLFCSYGEMFSCLPGKVSRGDVGFVKCKQKVFPLNGKVVFIWDKNDLGHRDLACHQARSRSTEKLFVSYERKVTFHTIFVRKRDLACKLVEMFSR